MVMGPLLTAKLIAIKITALTTQIMNPHHGTNILSDTQGTEQMLQTTS